MKFLQALKYKVLVPEGVRPSFARKSLLALSVLTSLLVLSGSNVTFGAGVPIKSSDQSANVSLGPYNPTPYDWGIYQGKEYVLYTSPFNNNSNYEFYNNVSLGCSFVPNGTTGPYATAANTTFTLYVTTNGSDWINMGSRTANMTDYTNYQFNWSVPFYFNQYKVTLLVNNYTFTYGSSFPPGSFQGTVTAQVYGVVADQDTAQNAQNAAQQAQQAAQQAANAANNVNTIVNSTLTVNAGVVQDSSGTVLTAARAARDLAQQANSKLDNVQNAVDKVQNTITNINQYLPPTLNKISGLNGATATSSGALQVVIDASNATQYSYRIDSGGWSPWMPIQDTVSIPVPKGVHTLTVQIANGPVGTPGPAAKSSMQVIGL